MLSSRRGGRVWILRLVPAVEPSTSLAFSHPLSADGINGRPGLRWIRWSSANVARTRHHRHFGVRCDAAIHSSVDRLFSARLPMLCTKFVPPPYKESLDGAWLAPFIFKPVGLFDI